MYHDNTCTYSKAYLDYSETPRIGAPFAKQKVPRYEGVPR